MISKLLSPFLVLGLLFFITSVSYGQTGKGTISGHISDSTGAPLAYASVSLDGISLGAMTDANGNFRISNIPPGNYTLIATVLGYKASRKDIKIEADETHNLNLRLKEDILEMDEVVIAFEDKKSYKVEKPSEQLRLQTTLIETPQDIVVVSEQIMKDQQAFNVNDLARNVSGVNSVFSYSNLYADFNIRGGGQGTGNNRLRNGIKPNWYAMMEDVSNIERVEFVKGPAGFMMNYGDPGGIFNVVTKQPTYQKIRSFTLNTGSWNLLRASTDFGGALGKENSRLSYRLTSAFHYGGQWQEHHTFNRYSLAPSIRYELSEKTSVTASYNLNYSKSRGGDPTIPSVDGKPFVLPQTFGIADPNLPGFVNYDHMGSLNLIHRFNAKWKLNGTIAVSDAVWKGYDITTRSVPDSAGMLNRQIRYTQYTGQNYISQWFVTGTEKTGSLEHKILAGLDLGLQQTQYPSYNKYSSPYLSIDINNPSYGLHPDSLQLASKERVSDRDEQQWNSLYLQDHIKITKWLQVSLGGRYSYFRNFASWNIPEDQTQKFYVFTPRVGVTIMPIEDISVYALYDQSFVPQAGRVFGGGYLKPLVGDIKEIGIKKEWFDKKLMTTIAFYDITRSNIVNPDPVNIDYVIQSGAAKTTGMEIDILGRVTKNISIIANYAYTDGRVTKDQNPDVIGVLPYGIVKHLANFWFKYQLTSTKLKGLGIAVGGTFDSGRGGGTFSSDGNFRMTTPSYTKLDAAVYYDLDNVSFALNIDNITNKEYMTGGYWDGAWFYKAGAPVNFRTSVNVRF